MSLSNKTHYALLGVSSDADIPSIDQAYRHLQQEYSGLSDGKELQVRLQLIAEAHACLTNPLRRRIYDNTLANQPAPAPLAKPASAGALQLKPIALLMAAVLVLGGAGWAMKVRHSTANSTTQATVYGNTLVKSYQLSDEAVTAYNEALAKSKMLGAKSLFELARDWQGEEFSPAADSNPYRMAIRINGNALANGEVSTRWQPMWSNQGPLMGSLSQKEAKAGEPVRLEGASAPVHFKSLQPKAPVLQFMDAKNIRISSITVDVWSGVGKNTWFEDAYAWSALLVPVIFLGFRLWARRG